MISFDVLDRHQKVHRHALLEASAGTGKTFAIENIVVRLLIEPDAGQPPLLLDKILIVTFTKAATRDLKVRIRINIEKSLMIVKDFIAQEKISSTCPDYLQIYLEEGTDCAIKIKRLLEQALFSFDQAQIFTIHGFAWRMLKTFCIEAGISMETHSQEDQPLLGDKLMQAVKDFLRTELVSEKYSTEQLKIILKRFKHNVDDLQVKLLKEVNRGIDVGAYPSFVELLEQFKCAMQELKDKYHFTSEHIVADFLIQVPFYKGLCDQSKQLHPENLQKIQRFSALFDKQQWQSKDFDLLIADGLFMCDAFDKSKISKKGAAEPPQTLHYPEFLKIIKEALEGIVESGRHETVLYARLACDCQKFIRRYQKEEELLGHNDLLIQMKQAINQPLFANRVRQAYRAVIVDEFQDTDPVQWEIFDALFSHPQSYWDGYLYLVGDPKQSIYAFRQADIYTYLSAAERLGLDSMATLDTNYRSQPKLIEALNLLFSEVDGLFPLPKISGHLPFRPVKAGKSDMQFFADSPACLHFWVAPKNDKMKLEVYEERYFFGAIAKELQRLSLEDNIGFGQSAILVADRYQGARLESYLKGCRIPVKNQKGDDLAKSSAMIAMREILMGILHCRRNGPLKVALGGNIIGMTHEELCALDKDEEEGWIKTLQICERLHHILRTRGFGHFYTELMQSVWHPHGRTISECILGRQEGDDFYRQWQDIADLLIAEQNRQNCSAEALVAFLDQFEVLAGQDDERIKGYLDLDEEGVSILTTHISKGLEFGIVFALGLIRPSKQVNKQLILIDEGDRQCLGAAKEEDLSYEKFCREIDAEKMRQLYVAMTRAKYRLYLPVAILSKGSSIPMGTPSPIELLMAKLNQPETDYQGLYQRLSAYDETVLQKFVDHHSSLMHLTVLNETQGGEAVIPSVSEPVLVFPSLVEVPGKTLRVQSFSSLASGRSNASIESGTEVFVPHEFEIELKNEHTLPSGNETGILLHRLFEMLPFSCAIGIDEAGKLLPWIRPFIVSTPFAAWENVIAKLIFQALTTPLPGCKNSFCLADVDPKKIYRETEFLYPCDECDGGQGVQLHQGYLKGVIDLFFEHEGRYYLLDWKSNWLGPSQKFYESPNLHESMSANQYDLQARLYVEALRRYFKNFGISFDATFGGAYYFFLRGISPSTGIWHDK